MTRPCNAVGNAPSGQQGLAPIVAADNSDFEWALLIPEEMIVALALLTMMMPLTRSRGRGGRAQCSDGLRLSVDMALRPPRPCRHARRVCFRGWSFERRAVPDSSKMK